MAYVTIPKDLTKVKDVPHNCAQTIHVIPADQNFEKKRNSSALFAREINLVTQPSFDCEQGKIRKCKQRAAMLMQFFPSSVSCLAEMKDSLYHAKHMCQEI